MCANLRISGGLRPHRSRAGGTAIPRMRLTAADGAAFGASRCRVHAEAVSDALAGLPARSEDDPRAFRRTFQPSRVHRVRMTILTQRPRGGWGSLVVLAGAGLLAIACLGKAALPLSPPASVGGGADAAARWALTHVAAATVALLTGPAPFGSGGERARRRAAVRLHRPDDPAATGRHSVVGAPAPAVGARNARPRTRPRPSTAGPRQACWSGPRLDRHHDAGRHGDSARRWSTAHRERG